ncbi:hypothetical protein EVAR_20767_1 [Eumeta japonica]|uniref:Uncharacterized protein n=1 Tax=Eumeta variegata TaxID=151549 RepID=A0A4C1VBR5_EUMVA|nr:hypothetical protein EVAR_20767_1 [Eumeta japonica]
MLSDAPGLDQTGLHGLSASRTCDGRRRARPGPAAARAALRPAISYRTPLSSNCFLSARSEKLSIASLKYGTSTSIKRIVSVCQNILQVKINSPPARGRSGTARARSRGVGSCERLLTRPVDVIRRFARPRQSAPVPRPPPALIRHCRVGDPSALMLRTSIILIFAGFDDAHAMAMRATICGSRYSTCTASAGSRVVSRWVCARSTAQRATKFYKRKSKSDGGAKRKFGGRSPRAGRREKLVSSERNVVGAVVAGLRAQARLAGRVALLRLGVTYEKGVTLGNVTMSHRTRERPAECLASLSHSTMIGLPRAQH